MLANAPLASNDMGAFHFKPTHILRGGTVRASFCAVGLSEPPSLAHLPAAMNRNVLVLASLQALLIANNAIAATLNVLVGHALASDKSLSTLPVTSWVVGSALSTFWASSFMRRRGRRAGFATGAAFGIAGTVLCAAAIQAQSFWSFVAGTAVLGVYNAFGAYHRFAAAEAVAEDARARAISHVLLGGLVGGVVGPLTTRYTVHALPAEYLGAFLSLIGFMVVALVVQRSLELPPVVEVTGGEPARPLVQVAVGPRFIVAALGASFGYGVMNLLMTATPIAMGACGHPYDAAVTVIASHVVGMFAPSFVTGDLIKRYGVSRVMLAGVVLNLACVVIALGGVRLAHFWWSLVLLGIGWNFVYVGATTLLTSAYRPSERAKAQGLNDAIMFTTMAFSSFFSGVILENNGWETLNRAAVPFVVAIGISLLWLGRRERARAEHAT
jgi:MFS family permease